MTDASTHTTAPGAASSRSATSTATTAQIRRQFIDFFVDKHGHSFAPSSPVVPHDDPTLLFANAGMNQFKDVFLGTGSRGFNRAVNSQKCIRAGGKHNDLEDVGADTYHHTFFEMLGNWSFGDYFKSEAIAWAWELLVETWGLDPDRIYATVFEGDASDGTAADTEAEGIWSQYLPADRISRWGKKDNFWEMGDVGPCGPCSEIHYDGRSDEQRAAVDGATLVNRDHPDVLEIWNLVFIEFNRAGGKLTPLPAKHVDTGMGLERIARVLQGKTSNYDIDIWQPIFAAIESHTGAHPYKGRLDDPVDTAYRIIADHARCLTVALTDGARPSNEGRGYVLRRILRRAVRVAHQALGVKGPVLCDIVPSVVDSLADGFPELRKNPEHVAEIIRDEEQSFLRTLDRGIQLFESSATAAGNLFVTTGASEKWEVQPDTWAYDQLVRLGAIDQTPGLQTFNYRGVDWSAFPGQRKPIISADDAFQLHDTYGFPIDLTRVMAQERGMTVDEPGYERLMEEARQRSRSGGSTGNDGPSLDLTPKAIAQLEHLKVSPTDDAPKYDNRPIGSDVKAIWNGTDFDNSAHTGAHVAIIVDRTNYYAEQGGQVGDRGVILTEWDPGQIATRGYSDTGRTGGATFDVEDTRLCGQYVLHIGRVTDDVLRVGDNVVMRPNHDRRASTQANHTMTHALNLALRNAVGNDVEQRGSHVAPDRLRFDYASTHPLTHAQLDQVQAEVNQCIAEALPVHADLVPLEKAKSINGVRAIFGEKYPDPVRVVSIGPKIDELLAEPANHKWLKYSIEFCGGTHLTSTDQAVRFAIITEQALAAGVRRIVAVTGEAARAIHHAGQELFERLNTAADSDDDAQFASDFDEISKTYDELTLPLVHKQMIAQRIEQLRDRSKSIRKQQQTGVRDIAVKQARSIADMELPPVICAIIDHADKDALSVAMDVIKAKHPNAATLLIWPDDDGGKVMIVASVPKELIAKGLKAGDWVREVAKVCGGSGGGKPDRAQAGGKDPAKAEEARNAARKYAARFV